MIKMKKIPATLLVIIFIIIIPLNAYAVNKDYVGHWAESTIDIWLDNNYISGYPDGSFKPDEPITRAEFITIINKLLGFSEIADISFIDVEINDWFYTEVQKAYKAGYISGFSGLVFSPNSNLTREQAAVIVSKLMGLELNPENVQAFADSNLISDWAKDYINAAAMAKIILGYSEDNTFRPQNPITRAEALTLIERVNQTLIVDPNTPEGTIILPPTPNDGGGGGGGGGAPGPIDPAPSAIEMSVINQIVMIGIGEEFNLENNLIINTQGITLTYKTDNADEIIMDNLKGKITGNKQGKITATVNASKEGYNNKTVYFNIIVAPIKISWTDPSGSKLIGEEQEMVIDISLVDEASSVENVTVNMIWEKLIDSNWRVVDKEDISITYNMMEVKMNNGIYQLIKGITVDNDMKDITTVVKFNKVGEYKLTVYCIKE